MHSPAVNYVNLNDILPYRLIPPLLGSGVTYVGYCFKIMDYDSGTYMA